MKTHMHISHKPRGTAATPPLGPFTRSQDRVVDLRHRRPAHAGPAHSAGALYVVDSARFYSRPAIPSSGRGPTKAYLTITADAATGQIVNSSVHTDQHQIPVAKHRFASSRPRFKGVAERALCRRLHPSSSNP